MSAVPEPAASPLLTLGSGEPGRWLALEDGQPVDLARFHGHVRGVAALLPAAGHVVNLCEDRYRFMVALCAASLRGQVTLLPPSRAAAAVADVVAAHPGTYSVSDQAEVAPGLLLPSDLPALPGPPPQVAAAALAVVTFTSGSTGRPKPYPKTWASLQQGCRQTLRALQAGWGDAQPVLLATVPPQHMYGLEISVMLPLLGGLAVANARPLFAEDVARALQRLPAQRVLVSTPVHLRSLLAAGVPMPAVTGLVSATAPLPVELAAQAEAGFGGPLHEVLGSTETGVIATRRSACQAAWTPLPGVALAPQPDGTLVTAPHLPAAVLLADVVAPAEGGGFVLQGRQADLLEIAGKRASLAELGRRLLAVPGVVDAVVVQLDRPDEMGVRRIAALAVAPGLDETTILQALRGAVDPVFLPRRLRLLPALPRNETGKIPRERILELLG